jgi:hypothetical protein
MCAAAPTPIRELYSLAFNPHSCLWGFMSHIVELTSPTDVPEMQSRLPRENNSDSSALGSSFVDGGLKHFEYFFEVADKSKA